MSENQQQYGPHNFGKWYHPAGTDASYRDCACGAAMIAVGATGGLSPESKPLLDPNQCRLNPIFNN